MVEPRVIVREIIDHIGKDGVIAGGSVRDIVLGRIPKDYDVFIYREEHHRSLVGRKGIFDSIPVIAKEPDTLQVYGRTMEVWNTTLHGQPVQLIWSSDHHRFTPSPEDVVGGFPFTVNMVYTNRKRKIVVDPRARQSMERKEILYNTEHRPPFNNNEKTVAHTIKRAFYLADKLGFKIPFGTIDAIYRTHHHIDELSSREWGRKEPANAIVH